MATFYADLSIVGNPGAPGSSTDPWGHPTWLVQVENGGQAAGSIFMQNGIYPAGYASVDPAITNANHTLDGWNRTEGGYGLWGVNNTFDLLSGLANNATGLTIRRGAFNDILGAIDAVVHGVYTFECCYFYDSSILYFGSTEDNSLYFNGCTFKADIFYLQYYGTASTAYVTDSLIDAQLDGGVGCKFVFTRCHFTKSQAEVLQYIDDANVTFINCTFDVVLSRELPTDITTMSESTMRYSRFGLPEIDADYTGYDHGFASEPRQGPGAFYFGAAQAVGTASVTEGSAPLDVIFTTEPDDDIGVLWDFNDGTYSEEWQVSKRYAAAGKYEVVLTWTDRFGYTSTQTITIYVYDWDYTGEGPWASYTDECLRLSMKPAKGLGWSEFGGEGWPFPEARVGPLKIIDGQNKERQLVLDSIWGRVVEIGKTDGFMDLAGGYEEQNIQTEIRFPEETGEAEHYFLESLEHHAHFRPFNENDGYMDDFTVDFSLLKDGAQSDTLKTQEIPLDGDVTLRPEDEAHRWQPRIVTTASGYRLVRLRDYYVVKDKAAAPDDRVMTEQSWEGDLGNVLMHMGRCSNPVLNFATGVDFTGSYSSTVTGPDGRDDSGVAFAGAGLTSADSLSLTGDFSICAWVGNIGSTQTILSQSSGFRVRVTVGLTYQLEYRDGSGTYTSTALSWGGSGWAMLTIVRSGSTLSMYHDDTLVFSQEITVVTNSGTVGIFPSSTGYGFDIKVIDGALEAGAVEYHHSDVTKKEGASTCPLF